MAPGMLIAELHAIQVVLKPWPRRRFCLADFLLRSVRVASYDVECDLWALGVVVYQMLCGRLPYQAADADGTMVQVLRSKVRQCDHAHTHHHAYGAGCGYVAMPRFRPGTARCGG